MSSGYSFINFSYDWLNVYEGGNDSGELSQALTGQVENGYTMTSKGNKLFLQFSSDSSESEKGFKIRYEGISIKHFPSISTHIILLCHIKFDSKSINSITVTSLGDVDPCGPSLPLIISDSNPGVILSPNYPSDYPENAYCGWFIQAKEKMKIVLTILEFDTEET